MRRRLSLIPGVPSLDMFIGRLNQDNTTIAACLLSNKTQCPGAHFSGPKWKAGLHMREGHHIQAVWPSGKLW
jgi:hypothetical protein